MLIDCPSCGSGHILSNKLEFAELSVAAQNAQAIRRRGHPRIALAALLCWGAMQAINAVIHAWQCGRCGRRFS